MGLLDRWRNNDRRPWSPPAEGSCGCRRHLDDELLGTVVPLSPDAGLPEEVGSLSVAELIDCQALGCEPVDVGDRTLTDGTGPYHWNLWFGDETRPCYSDNATLQLDAAVAQQDGVERTVWLDREVIYIGAPRLCSSGALAVAALGLLDPGVRDQG
ncbi:hypothetical protein [Ornithinicoccus halotolerans]|uniref:hypothetical protein n=1 Tax=Ornithinicoccus halotolerans TaxID=1748220 RepID=UPI0012955682|nr:hypothetical protein [Ornithinicoccus halotolerans]